MGILTGPYPSPMNQTNVRDFQSLNNTSSLTPIMPFNNSGSLANNSNFKPNATTLVQRIMEDDNGTEIIVEEEEEEEIVSMGGDPTEDDKAQAI